MDPKLFGLVVIVATFLSPLVTRAGDPEVIDGIAAVVNNDVITFSQVQELSGPEEQQLRQQFTGAQLIDKVKESRLSALNDLINRQLILQEYKKKDYNIPEYVFEDQVKEIIKDDFGNDRQAFLRTITAQGYTMNKFRDMQKDKVIVQVMRQQEVKGNFQASEQDIQAYYNANKQEFATPDQVKLRMIVLNSDPLDPNSAQNTSQMATEIRAKAAKPGADFAGLAKTYSMDGAAENGGDWGWVDQKTLNEELTKAAFSLGAGQISPVVTIGDSFYILYCEAKKPTSFTPLADVHDQIAKKLEQGQRQKATLRWIDTLREKAFIKVY